MSDPLELVAGTTTHARKGGLSNAFRYHVDYVLLDPEAQGCMPFLFRRNRRWPISLHDRDHGGAPGQGTGVAWVRDVLADHGVDAGGKVLLLAQPRVMGHVFNPVSFWLCHDTDGAMRAVVAEVTNTYGDRHSYLCTRADGGAIGGGDWLDARKAMYVSPFQPLDGGYRIRVDLRPDRLGVWVDFTHAGGGLYTVFTGRRQPLTSRALLHMCLAHPFGGRRVLALIHWQALVLWWRGARFRSRPEPPSAPVSR